MILVCSFFKDAFDEYNLTTRGVLVSNLVFSVVMSIIYGFLFGFFALAINAVVFKVDSILPWHVILGFCLLIELLQIQIIFNLKNEKVFFPEIYLNTMLMFKFIFGEKIIIKQLVKAFMMFIFYFALINYIFISLTNSELFVIKYLSVTLSMSFLIPILIMSKVPVTDFKSSAKFSVIQVMLILVYLMFTLYTTKLGSGSNQLGDFSLTTISLLSLLFTLQSVISSFRMTYIVFSVEFAENIAEVWSSLKPEYGFTKYFKKSKIAISELRYGVQLLKVDWKNGKKVSIIVRFALMFSFLFLYYHILKFMLSESGNLFYEELMTNISNIWISFFYGDREYAGLTFAFLLILTIWGFSFCGLIKNEKGSELYVMSYQGFAMSTFMILPVLGLFPQVDFKTCIYLEILVILSIAIFKRRCEN